MRSRGTEVSSEFGNQTYAGWLLQLGDDKLPKEGLVSNLTQVPQSMVVGDFNFDSLIHAIYSSLENVNDQFFNDKVILAPTNEEALKINNSILERLAGEPHTFSSIDRVDQMIGTQQSSCTPLH
ncbi:unnamed protein product [Calypogeia fissa]